MSELSGAILQTFEALLASETKGQEIMNCGRSKCQEKGIFLCRECKSVSYCSEKCQQEDLRYHKFMCFKEPSTNNKEERKARKLRDAVFEKITDNLLVVLPRYYLSHVVKARSRICVALEFNDNSLSNLAIQEVTELVDNEILSIDRYNAIMRLTKPYSCCIVHMAISKSHHTFSFLKIDPKRKEFIETDGKDEDTIKKVLGSPLVTE